MTNQDSPSRRSFRQYALVRRIPSVLAVLLLVAAIGSAAVAQTLEVTPDVDSVFSFAGVEGGTFLPETPTTWTLRNAGTSDLEFVVSESQVWLALTRSAGSLSGPLGLGPRELDVRAELNAAEAAKLAPGLYQATVTFLNLTNEVGNTSRTVRMRIAPAGFTASPGFVNVTASVSSANPPPVAVTLQGTGAVDLNYRLTWVARGWFNVDKAAGTVPAAGRDTFNITFNTFGVAVGTYSAQILIDNVTNGIGNRQLPVSLIVQQTANGVVTLRPDTDVEAAGPAGNIPRVGQASTLANGDDLPVLWSAGSSEDWVSVSPGSGELAANNLVSGGTDETTVDIRINAAVNDLEAGSHSAVITFQNVNTPATPVTIATRVVRVVANPVLSLSVPAVGGSVSVVPGTVAVTGPGAQAIASVLGGVVTLTSIAADGYVFQGWTADFNLDSETANPLSLAMDRSRSVSALFVPTLRELSLSMEGQGTGTVTASPTATALDNELVSRYNHGTQIRLQADADAGSAFVGWEGNVPAGHERDNPLTVPMDRDRVVTARFEQSIELSVSLEGSGQVRVEPQKDGYVTGDSVTLFAEPDPAFVFAGWGGDISGSGSPITLTLTDDTVVSAVFSRQTDPVGATFSLTVEVAGDGTVTPDGGEFEGGQTVTLVATPAVGASFTRWDGDASGEELTTSVVMIADRTVQAVFTEAPDDGTAPRPTPGLFSSCGAAGLVEFSAMFLGLALYSGRGRRGRLGQG